MIAGFDRRQQFGIAAAIACITIVGVGLSLGLLLLSFVLEARGVSGTMIGLIAAMGGVATILVSPVAPGLIRRLGAKTTLNLAIALTALSLLAFYWAESLWLWFVLRLINGAGLAVLLVICEFWINSLVPPERRGTILGLYAAAQSIGFAIGPALVAVIGPEGLLPFAVGAGVMLLAVLPAFTVSGGPPQLEKPGRRSLLSFLRRHPAATLAAFVFGAVEAGMNLLPIYGLQVGQTATIAALLATAIAVGNVALQTPIGVLADKIDRRKLLLACGVVALAGALLMPLVATSAVLFLGLLFVWGGVVASLYSVGLARITSDNTGADLASANAAFVMLYSGGRLVGPAVVGAGLDLWRPHGFAAGMALFLAIYVVVAAVGLLSPKQRTASDPSR